MEKNKKWSKNISFYPKFSLFKGEGSQSMPASIHSNCKLLLIAIGLANLTGLLEFVKIDKRFQRRRSTELIDC